MRVEPHAERTALRPCRRDRVSARAVAARMVVHLGTLARTANVPTRRQLTEMTRGFASSAFGRVSESTPSFISALIRF